MIIPRNLLLTAVALTAAAQTPHPPRALETVIVYREAGRFAGWPANHGAWNWGDELVVGFESGYFKVSPGRHAIDYSRPADHLLARSRDGGKSWAIERPESLQPPAGAKVANVPAAGGRQPVVCTPGEGIIPFWYGDGERLTPDAPIALEAYSGRWLRFERAP